VFSVHLRLNPIATMAKTSLLALLAVSLLAPLASAQAKLQLANKRIAYGPFGATRADMKFLPGDYLFMTFDMEGLTIDPATGKAAYETILRLLDSNQKTVFEKKTETTVLAMLGGTRVPGELNVIMGLDRQPGKYSIQLTITDKASKARQSIVQPFELLPREFGLVGVGAGAIGLPGQKYLANFALINMKLDAKNQPNVEVVMRVLDDSGTKEFTRHTTLLPRDLPPGGPGLEKENFVPMQFPIVLNRPGQFTIEIEATDKAANRQVRLRYKLNVLDVEKLLGR
jgi:hypothetical protein